MHKLPVSEAAEYLGISKEAIYNRIRRGSLKTLEKDGQKYVIIEDASTQKSSEEKKPAKPRTQNRNKNESEFVAFLISELENARAQNLSLQADKERLFKEKEQMLINAKTEISQIYKERDEQLMAFLNAMQKPLLSRSSEPVIEATLDENDLSESSSELKNEPKKWQNLSEFLREQNLDQKARKKAQKAIIKRIGRSKFIKFKEGVILIRKNKTLKEVIQ